MSLPFRAALALLFAASIARADDPPASSGAAAAAEPPAAAGAAVAAEPARAAPAASTVRAAAGVDAARIAPGAADAVLLLSGQDALLGVRSFLETAGQLAPTLNPADLGRLIERRLGLDLLATHAPLVPGLDEKLPWGVADGPRAAVLLGRTLGFTGAVAKGSEVAARKALGAWLGQPGKPKKAGKPVVVGRGKTMRAGLVAPVQGGTRLLIATGLEADKLVELMAQVGRGKRPLSRRPELKAALAAAKGTAILYVRGEGPARAAVLSLHGAPRELSAGGVVVGKPQPLLEGPPLSAAFCEGGPLLCARVGLGAGGEALLALVWKQWAELALAGPPRDVLDKLIPQATAALSGPSALRLEMLDLDRLASADPLWALSFTAAGLQQGFGARDLPASLPRGVSRSEAALSFEGERPVYLRASEASLSFGDGEKDGPAPQASTDTDSAFSFDLPGLGRALRKASPLSALRGQLPAAAFTAQLLFGKLFAASEPIAGSARPSTSDKDSADLEVHWRLR